MTRRASVLFLVLALAAARPARAHPGMGIVRDAQGNVFYTDLERVWRIAPDGRKSVAVPDVHTHELMLDEAGNLYGEDSRYMGGERWRTRVWRRSPDGRVGDVAPWREGFWRAHGLTRDARGGTYLMTCPERRCTLSRCAPDGRISVVAGPSAFAHQVNAFAATASGAVVVVHGADIARVEPTGRLTVLARGLGRQLMGLAPQPDGSVLVAAWGDAAVKRVAADGRVSVVARSATPWAPSGVTRAPDGTLWLLETSTANAVRVRRVTNDGRSTIH